MDTKTTALAHELLTLTATHYNSSNRAHEPGSGSLYETQEGTRCSIGRIMSDDGIEWIKKNGWNHSTTIAKLMKRVDVGVVQEHWRDLFSNPEGIGVAMRIQQLHDTEENWDENGLTSRGIEETSKIDRIILGAVLHKETA